MSLKIEEWIEQMRLAKNPGPVVRVTVARNGRDMGWSYDVDDDTNVTGLAERIDNSTRNGGFSMCELRAFDAQGRFMEALQHKVEGVQIVQQVGSGLSPGVQMGLEATIASSLKTNRDFTELGLESLKQAHQLADRAMKRLEDENTELRRENERLRQKVADMWDVMEKLNTHELETKHEMLKLEQLGNLGGTFAKALMSRVMGTGTPEGQAINFELAMKLFRSLSTDVERVNKILPILTDAERLSVMELMRVVTEPSRAPDAANDPPKLNGLAAASAAASANVHGVEGRSS
jgi:hypothetical protein